ncbi:MAG TPA: outer membrane beta-barrel protein [Pseudolabrys sp.]|jgi:opacity protein-like surface antigen
MTCTIRTSRAALAALTLVLAVPAGASAQDFLRGSLFNGAATRWDGINLGVQLGLSNMNADFGNSTSALVAFALRNTEVEDQFSPSSWTTLPSTTTNGRQYGAFLGYNVQWDQLVIGFDLAYNRTSSLTASASDSISRQVVTTPDNVNNAVTITAQSSVTLIDYATMRARAGYSFGQFLPYAVVGAAVGRFNYSNTATVQDVGTPPSGSPTLPFNTLDTESDSKNNAIAAGVLAGLGLDVAVLPNVFVRAEWEYIAFAPVGGIRTTLNTGRVGIGARF